MPTPIELSPPSSASTRQTTWMIGNSPRSDIVAARQAGWRAVFIPHPATWSHEEAELDLADPGILQLASFAELRLHF